MREPADMSALRIVYGYKPTALADDTLGQVHQRITKQLAQAKARELIQSFEIREQREAFEREVEGKELLRQLRELAMRSKIKVRFGSRKDPYECFPLQFVLVYH